MSLTRRVAKLERSTGARVRPEPVMSPEDRAVAQRIIDNMYADPVRHASRIALLDRLARRHGPDPGVTGGG